MSVKVDKNNLNRKVFALKDFRGVDYASSPLEVKPYRATDMANLLLRDGMLRKRNGFKQIDRFHISADEWTSVDDQYKIKWFPWGVSEHGYPRHVFQIRERYSASSFFYIDYGFGYKRTQSISGASKLGSAVAVGDELYIFCGEYVKITKDYAVEKIGEDNSYVPTTTINIPITSVISHSDDSNSQNTYYTFDADTGVRFPMQGNESINLLTALRKNTFMVRQAYDYEQIARDTLRYFHFDGDPIELPADPSEDVDDFKIPRLIYGNESINFRPLEAYDEIGFEANRIWICDDFGVAICRRTDFLPQGVLDERSGERTQVLVVYDSETFRKELAHLPADSSGYVNFTVQYWDTKSWEDVYPPKVPVTTCSAATLFGVDGANDRIFVGGGKDGNMVYISENDITLKPNPTYFPADQFLVCGTSASKVNGFMRVSNGTLAIFKDVTANEDVSVYYTSGSYTDVGTGEEGNTYKQARFTVTAGDIQRKGISAKAIENFEGDNIFVSNEGVFGIQLSNNVASGERYARERSRTINPKITKLGLANAKGIVYNDKYFLAVDNGEVYVADARYKFTLQGDQQDTFNYEWFRLTGLYVKEWFISGDKLCFIDKDGYVCEFTDGYADELMATSNNNEILVKDGRLTVAEKLFNRVKSASYAVDQDGQTWELQLTEDKNAFIVPDGIKINEDNPLTLWFQLPINAYWQSPVMAFENAMWKKNMWSLSVTMNAEDGGKIDLGYKTRFNAVDNIEVEGANASIFDDVNFAGNLFTFDQGGYLGINTYRRRVFERGFTHIQLLFNSNTVGNCAVDEIDVEYSITMKNIGVS